MLADGQDQSVQRNFEVRVRQLMRNLAAGSVAVTFVDHATALQPLQFTVCNNQALRFA